MAQSWEDFAASYGTTGPIGALSGVHNSKRFNTMANQIAGAIGYTGPLSMPGTYEAENSNEGGTYMQTMQGQQATPEFLKALEAYQFSRDKLDGTISQNGQAVGSFTAGDKDSGLDKFLERAIPVGLGLLAGGTALGAFGGGGAAAAGAAGAADIGALGLAEGVYGAGGALGAGAAPGTVGGLAGSTAGFGGLGSVLPAGAGYGAASGGLSGLLGSAKDAIGGASGWMKANPMMGRLLMGGATSLLSGAGGGESGAPQASNGPPVQWNSGIQQGLLAPVQQYAPAAVQQNRPAGLLAQGQANDGAWRYLRG